MNQKRTKTLIFLPVNNDYDIQYLKQPKFLVKVVHIDIMPQIYSTIIDKRDMKSFQVNYPFLVRFSIGFLKILTCYTIL